MSIQLYAIERGQGTPMIFLHGNGESSDYFAQQLPDFARDFHVCAIDTRGHGRSPRGHAPFTLAQFAKDLAAFVDEHGFERFILFGFSDGANIALLYALAHPARVEALILNGANLNPRGIKPLTQIPILLGYAITSLLAHVDAGAVQNRDLLALMVKEPHIETESLAALTMPTLVIVGTHDMILRRHSRAIAAALPNADFCMVEGDHFIAQKNSAPFNQAVRLFLQNKCGYSKR